MVEAYSLGADWDDRWRTGGSVDEVIEEAHLDKAHILDAIERFVRERELRLGRSGRRWRLPRSPDRSPAHPSPDPAWLINRAGWKRTLRGMRNRT